MTAYNEKCTTCAGTGKRMEECPECKGRASSSTETMAVTEDCPVPNCRGGWYATQCQKCEGEGCEVCKNTGKVLFDQAKKPHVKPKVGTHSPDVAHLIRKCRICEGTGKITRRVKIPVPGPVCGTCGGKGKVFSEHSCHNCGGTGNKQLGNKIPVEDAFKIMQAGR